jgi:hypothetical protein
MLQHDQTYWRYSRTSNPKLSVPDSLKRWGSSADAQRLLNVCFQLHDSSIHYPDTGSPFQFAKFWNGDWLRAP